MRHDQSFRAFSSFRSLSFNAISLCLNLSSHCVTAISLLSTPSRLFLSPAVVVAASAPIETDDCPSDWVRSTSSAASRSKPLSLDEPFQVRVFGGAATSGMMLADVRVVSPPNEDKRSLAMGAFAYDDSVDHNDYEFSTT